MRKIIKETGTLRFELKYSESESDMLPLHPTPLATLAGIEPAIPRVKAWYVYLFHHRASNWMTRLERASLPTNDFQDRFLTTQTCSKFHTAFDGYASEKVQVDFHSHL